MNWLVTSLPVTEDDSTSPGPPTCPIVASNRAAGTRIVSVPVVEPSVCDDRTNPPFVCAIATTRASFVPNEPSGTERAIVPSRMIFERSEAVPVEACFPGFANLCWFPEPPATLWVPGDAAGPAGTQIGRASGRERGEGR